MNKTMKLMAESAFALLIAIPATAQTPEASLLPVDEPLDVGGTVLQPGVYLIRVLPTRDDRETIQITDRDRKKVYATVLTVPHPLEPNEQVPSTRFIFYPPENGHPKALRTWFAKDPVASQGGHDIVYPEGRARILARTAKVDVISYPESTPIEDFDTTTLSVVTPRETIEVYTPPTPIVPPPPVVVAEVAPPPPPPMISQVTDMPDTASNIPLMAMLGILSLVAAIAIRVVRQ